MAEANEHLALMPVFIAVVERQSFAGAARQLGMTTSAVSKQIQQLEARLGIRLLHRTTRRLSLTEEGRVLFEHGRRMLEGWREVICQLRDQHSAPRGTLRINAPMSFGRLHLAEPIALFAQRYPEVALDVDFDDRLVDVIAEGYDVVIRISAQPDSTMVARKLAPCPILHCASPAYLAQHGTPDSPQALRHHRMIEYSAHGGAYSWRYQGPDGRTGSVTLRGAMRANNAEMMLAAARAGLGISLLPIFSLADAIAKGELVTVLPAYTTHPARDVVALFPHNRQLSTKVRVFVDFLAEHFARGSGLMHIKN